MPLKFSPEFLDFWNLRNPLSRTLAREMLGICPNSTFSCIQHKLGSAAINFFWTAEGALVLTVCKFVQKRSSLFCSQHGFDFCSCHPGKWEEIRSVVDVITKGKNEVRRYPFIAPLERFPKTTPPLFLSQRISPGPLVDLLCFSCLLIFSLIRENV